MKVFIRTLGCPKNEADSEYLRGALVEAGFLSAARAQDADVVIVNTCSFVEAARQESIDAVLDEVARRRPSQKVVVSGCLVERYGAELAEALPDVDGFMSLGAYARAPLIVAAVARGQRLTCLDEGKVPMSFDVRPPPASPTAYVKISEGCDRTCSFCAIPAIRGPHRSRPMGAVVAEVRSLAAQGVKEVVLVGQDMSLYGRDRDGRFKLPDLIRSLADVEGLVWLRTLYHYPRFVTGELLAAMEACPAAVPYFDLSLQHASGRILRAMRRWGDGDRFLALIGRIRDRFPHAVLRSAFIAGFPGETEQDVDELARFLVAAELDWAGFFSYSPEQGTRAAAVTRRPSRRVARQRAEALAEVQMEVSLRRRAALVGGEIEVLVERRQGTAVWGRTWREAPEVDAEVRVVGARGARPGDLVRARVASTEGLDLVARAL